jgi:3-hydroxyisobutyrate dehydrogenase-like beta-hydroxyacid dehydrogenase
MTAREPVTVIGLGAMGSAMAEVFLAAGHPTTVWNRTPGRADPLVAKGATRAASPAEALTASGVTVLSLVDYAAMTDILGDVEHAAFGGRVLVNLSSDTPERLREADRWVAARGGRLVTGGIMAPPPGIGQPGAYTFYSGPRDVVEAHRATLEALGRVDHVGADPGLAMLYYQAMLTVFWTSLVGYFHAAALLGTAGVTAKAVHPYVAELLGGLVVEGPMGFLNTLAREIDAREYPGEENNLHMQAVGAEHVVDTFRDAGLDTGMPAALSRLFAAADAAGHGADGLSSVMELIRRPSA